MKLRDFIGCLQAREKTLTKSLSCRKNRKQDFSSWRFNSTEELGGRLSEVKNTLNMIEVVLRGKTNAEK